MTLDGVSDVAVEAGEGVLIAGFDASFGADWVGEEQGGVVKELSLEAQLAMCGRGFEALQ